MKRLLFLPVAAAITLLQALPLLLVAWMGRRMGALAWYFFTDRRRLALENLETALGDELDETARTQVARENFRLLGEAILCALRTAVMTREELASKLQVAGLSKLRPWIERTDVPGIVIATGHFANIEMYAHAALDLPWMRAATVFRASKWWLVNRVLDHLHREAPCEFLELQQEKRELRTMLNEGNVILGLMADVSPGPRGYAVPFFGRPVSTSPTPALYALRRNMPLHAAVCFRTGLGRWRVEISDEIPTRIDSRARPLTDILQDLNAHLERNIRRDPANWFWMQPRWEHSGRVRWRRKGLAAT